MGKVREGFTVIGDITDMKVPPQAVMDVLVQIQELVMGAGMRKAAEVVGSDILSLAVDRIALSSGLIVVKRQFRELGEAEAWLASDGD